MFDLNRSLDEWRQQLRRGGWCLEDDIAELEEHLHEEMTSLGKLALSQEEAFLLAARRLGKVDMLTEEFGKINAHTVWFTRLRWMGLGVLASLGCLLGHYLALHDIFSDYASPKVLREQANLAAGSLPDWTACPLEWGVVGVGFWLMLLFHVGFLVSLVWHATRQSDGVVSKTL